MSTYNIDDLTPEELKGKILKLEETKDYLDFYEQCMDLENRRNELITKTGCRPLLNFMESRIVLAEDSANICACDECREASEDHEMNVTVTDKLFIELLNRERNFWINERDNLLETLKIKNEYLEFDKEYQEHQQIKKNSKILKEIDSLKYKLSKLTIK